MTSSSLARAWMFTASKNNSSVSLNLAWGPGPQSGIQRDQKLRPKQSVQDSRLRLEICFFEAKRVENAKRPRNSLSSEFAWVKFLLGLFFSWKNCRHIFARKPESVHDTIGKDIRVACHHAIANVIPIRVDDMSASELAYSQSESESLTNGTSSS